MDSSKLPRYTTVQPKAATEDDDANGNTLRVSNGHPTPVSPSDVVPQVTPQIPANVFYPIPEGGGTLRFMLDPQRATAERAEVARYYTDEWEEVED